MEGIVLTSPGRVLFSVCGFEIYTYGVCVGIAILIGTLVSNWMANRSNKLPKDVFLTLIPALVLFGLLGARLWYCLLNLSQFSSDLMSILNLRTGGISIHGAILGGFLYLFIYSKLKKINLVSLCDYSVLGLILGQAIGRLGNFFNNEAFGLPYDGFIKLFIPPQNRPMLYLDYSYFHPTFLYEITCNIVIFGVLFWVATKKRFVPGDLTLMYLIFYSLIRFFIEQVRIDSNFYIYNLPFPAFVSLLIFLCSLIFLVTKRYK